ncbi:hypothetical protein M1567_00815 [Candidatus Marsarchaeota archaeon]|jgi:type II secretory pathway pseudopilin PulG|nr:hypothetical protein [Candidatus Marsarchaeota archaeon]
MRGFEILLSVVMLSILLLLGTANAQYWFQSGVRSSQNYSYNNGASINIETVYPQNITYGSFGFWVGEILSNGAFIQVGYEIPNQSGYYPTNCSPNAKCTGKVIVKKGEPSWFWEYFPQGDNSNNFYGSVGPNDSVGLNGTFNAYSFKYSNGEWNIYLNAELIGTVNLGTSNSGQNVPTVFGEYANANNNDTYMEPVKFSNFTVYKNGIAEKVSTGYSYIGYGTGSLQNLRNSYGVEEVAPYVNVFKVGSGLPTPINFTTLWSYGYYLKVSSNYGHRGTAQYSPYASFNLSEPEYIYLSNSTREHFIGWQGTGIGSYTGISNSTKIIISSNITETAEWQTQYLVNVSSAFGNVTGSGWYTNGTLATISISTLNISTGPGVRYHFYGFGNISTEPKMSIKVTGPLNAEAIWKKQYLISGTTPYGNVTGSGWYDSNATARLSVSKTSQQINATVKKVFVSWSNISDNSTIQIMANRSVNLTAIFGTAFKETIITKSESGSTIKPSLFYFDGKPFVNLTLFMLEGHDTIGPFEIDGVNVTPETSSISVLAPGSIDILLPVYNVTVYASNIFGAPISGTVEARFQNGTVLQKRLNSNGTITFTGVPYGNVSGEIEYSGFSSKFSSSYSNGVRVKMVTPAIIIAIALVTIAVATFWFYLQFRRKKKR